MKRPTGWKPNPQALSNAGSVPRGSFTGSAELQSHQADGDTWLTPKYILDHLGAFDLDPCAAESNPDWAAPRSYTKANNGLALMWSGRVWCNPPFSDVRPWIASSARHGSGVLLVPASVESRTWREIVWPKATAILLLHGRTRFCRPDGSATVGRPLKSIALVTWTQEDAAVLEAAPFAGALLKSWRQR